MKVLNIFEKLRKYTLQVFSKKQAKFNSLNRRYTLNMKSTTLLNSKIRFSQWIDIMRQLRPSVTSEAIGSLVPWQYRFVTSVQHNEVVGVGAYFPTASLVRGRYNYLADFVVDSKYRGKGIGASMMQEILASSIPCELDSGLQRIDAHRFYHKLGFDFTGYTVRLKSEAFAIMSDLPQQQIYPIDGVHHLQKQSENRLKCIQAFVDKYATVKAPYHKNLLLFMRDNLEHRSLILQGKTGEVEGILLYELQNRLSVGGNCFYVSDLLVKDGPEATERQSSLLLFLTYQVKEHNLHDCTSPIQSIIVEMAEQEAKNHKLLKSEGESESPEDKSSLIRKLNMTPFFSVTAKHFVKAAPNKDESPSENWYLQQKSMSKL